MREKRQSRRGRADCRFLTKAIVGATALRTNRFCLYASATEW
jgi:hypothetical protein